jgi:hypothetical protein
MTITASYMAAVAAAALHATGAGKISAPPPRTVAGAVVIQNARFVLPANCALDCALATDAYHGTLRCATWPAVGYYAGLMVRPAFPQASRFVEGQQRIGAATAYWGTSDKAADPPRSYCVVLRYPADWADPKADMHHQFCTTSRDPRLHEILRSAVTSYTHTTQASTCKR